MLRVFSSFLCLWFYVCFFYKDETWCTKKPGAPKSWCTKQTYRLVHQKYLVHHSGPWTGPSPQVTTQLILGTEITVSKVLLAGIAQYNWAAVPTYRGLAPTWISPPTAFQWYSINIGSTSCEGNLICRTCTHLHMRDIYGMSRGPVTGSDVASLCEV